MRLDDTLDGSSGKTLATIRVGAGLDACSGRPRSLPTWLKPTFLSATRRGVLPRRSPAFDRRPRRELQWMAIARRARLTRRGAREPHQRWMLLMNRPRRQRSSAVQSPLETYLREINETALLSADEEKQLANEIEKGNSEARDRMV